MLDKNSPFAVTNLPRREESRLSLAVIVLTQAIIDCDPAPGAVVSELELDKRFSLGLASVRGALARLSVSGHVLAEGRRGWRILPVSPGHLADIVESRACLEPVLVGQALPEPLRDALSQKALLHRSALPTLKGATMRHQERALLALCAQAIPSPRLRGWLAETWDLSLRADRFLAQTFGVERPPLPVADLADALVAEDPATVKRILETMRQAFAARCDRALARSDAPIAPKPALSPSQPVSPRGRGRKKPTDTTGAAPRVAQQGEPK